MPVEKQLGSLLRKERETLGLTQKEVSGKMGFSHYQILSYIESGEREIKAWELAGLSRIYGRDVNYFLFPEEKNRDAWILWRNPDPSKQKERVKRKFLSYCEKYRNLLRLLGEKEVENRDLLLPTEKGSLLNNYSFEYVAKKATDYTRLLQLGSRPACSLAKILEDKIGIKIFHLSLPQGISGGSTISDFGMAVLINSEDAPWRRHFDLAHEFFHLVTWDYFPIEQIYKEGKNNIEKLANVFASAILMPEDEIRREVSRKAPAGKITYLSLIEIAQEFEVSIDALLWRLVNLNIMDKKVALREIETGTLKETDKKTREKVSRNKKPYLSSRYISLAIKAFHLGKISRLKFAEYVGIRIGDVSTFLEQNGFREDQDYSVEYSVT